MQIYKALLIFFHILSGLFLLVASGALLKHDTALVKRIKQWWLGRVVSLLDMEILLEGDAEKYLKDSGMLLVSNHVSWVDIPVIGGIHQTFFLSKSEVKNWPLIGTLAAGVGTLFIKRGSGDSKSISQSISNRLNQGHSVLFFPEGTTTSGESVKRFHPKLFNACKHSDAKVCPLTITYEVPGETFNPVPYIDDDEFAEHLWNLLRYRRIIAHVNVLQPRHIDTSNIRNEIRNLQKEMQATIEMKQQSINSEYEHEEMWVY